MTTSTTPKKNDYRVYLVGGAVRNELLGLPVKERDWVVVGADEASLIAEGFKRVGRSFPVFLHPKTREEYALARTEKKVGVGYQGFICDFHPQVTLEEDLLRRDLSINAIAKGPDGKLIDPYGGLADLKARRLRHVSAAFAEDPVRILRVARFMATFAHLGFTVAEETLALMRQMVKAGEVDALVPERVWQEMEKALGEADPAQFFEVLRACGALSRLFPALDKLWGIPQPAQHHPEIDTGIHTMMVLSQAARLSSDTTVRFAALCHDLGKGETPPEQWPKHHGHEKEGVSLLAAWCKQYGIPTEYRELALAVTEYHGLYGRAFELKPSTLLSLFESISALRKPARLEQFILACEADARGRTGRENETYAQSDYLRAAFSAVQTVNVQKLMANGFEGAALGAAIRRERLLAIKHLKAAWPS
jgi:tRNA nucleotidyltransferase (CCA-adding enzyme)